MVQFSLLQSSPSIQRLSAEIDAIKADMSELKKMAKFVRKVDVLEKEFSAIRVTLDSLKQMVRVLKWVGEAHNKLK